MGMPNHIVFIRHGESEANVIQKRDKRGEDVTTQESLAVRRRIDYKQRLSKKGAEQVMQARNWINKNICEVGKFDSYFVSSFFRARETAAYISANNPEIKWEIDDRLAERNWGVHGPLTIAERKERYEVTDKLMYEDPFHAAFEGGESIWGVKNERIRNLMNTWVREQDGKKILIVTHGDLIRAARVGIERILPEEFETKENCRRWWIFWKKCDYTPNLAAMYKGNSTSYNFRPGKEEEPLNNKELKIYPNPASNSINIDFSEEYEKANCTITDMTGRVVKSEQITSSSPRVNLSGLPHGVYLLNIQFDNKNSLTTKFVINE